MLYWQISFHVSPVISEFLLCISSRFFQRLSSQLTDGAVTVVAGKLFCKG